MQWLIVNEFGEREVEPEYVSLLNTARKRRNGRIDRRTKEWRKLRVIEDEVRAKMRADYLAKLCEPADPFYGPALAAMLHGK